MSLKSYFNAGVSGKIDWNGFMKKKKEEREVETLHIHNLFDEFCHKADHRSLAEESLEFMEVFHFILFCFLGSYIV